MPISLDNESIKFDSLSATDINRIRSTRYGDGYEQRRADGINFSRPVWNVTFAFRSKGALMLFLDALRSAGVVGTYVNWTSPTDITPQKYTVDNYTINIMSLNYSEVSCTLSRWFGA